MKLETKIIIARTIFVGICSGFLGGVWGLKIALSILCIIAIYDQFTSDNRGIKLTINHIHIDKDNLKS